jgi:hypothetical protein
VRRKAASSPLSRSPARGRPKMPTSERGTGAANLRAAIQVPSPTRTSKSISSHRR